MNKISGIILLLLTQTVAFSQPAGETIFEFLNLPPSARVGALGGKQISIFDDDLNFVHNNPSLLNGSMSNNIALNYINYLADINYSYVSYARTYDDYGNFGVGIQYFNYGAFQYANEVGYRTGETFKASDYTLNLYYSRLVLDSLFHVGGALRAISSEYEIYNAFGLGLDAGITYHNSEKLFTAAFVIKNLGFQLNTYSNTSGQESFPFELQFGITQKLKYAPFRFSVLVQNIETPNLRYKTEEDRKEATDPLTGEPKEEDKLANFGDNVFRHLVFGLEFVPTRNFHIDLGYNYKRRQELKIVDKPGFTGFSFGFGLKVYKFRISYSHATYHLAGVSDQFSLNLNLSEFSR
jgi:hypothetical protein